MTELRPLIAQLTDEQKTNLIAMFCQPGVVRAMLDVYQANTWGGNSEYAQLVEAIFCAVPSEIIAQVDPNFYPLHALCSGSKCRTCRHNHARSLVNNGLSPDLHHAEETLDTLLSAEQRRNGRTACTVDHCALAPLVAAYLASGEVK